MSTEEILQHFLNIWDNRMRACDEQILHYTTEKNILQRCRREVEIELERVQGATQ